MELVLLMYNAHPCFSLKNLGRKVHYTWEKYGTLTPKMCACQIQCIQSRF